MPTTKRFPVTGRVAPGFEPVRAAFQANFAKRGEIGAAVCVTVDGQPVVDLGGGASDAAGTRAWTKHDCSRCRESISISAGSREAVLEPVRWHETWLPRPKMI